MNCKIGKYKIGVSTLALFAAMGVGTPEIAYAGTVSCAAGGGTTPSGWTAAGLDETGGYLYGGVAATAAPYVSPSSDATDCYIVTDSGAGYPANNGSTLSASSIPGAPSISHSTEGAYMASPVFTASAGQQLNFNFSFITNDGSGTYSDWAAAYLYDPTSGTSLNLFTARTGSNNQVVPGFGFSGFPAGLTLTPSTASLQGNTFYLDPNTGSTSSGGNATRYGPTRFPNTGKPGGSTPWIDADFTFDAADAGSYELIMATSNVSDDYYASGLLFTGESISGPVIVPPSPMAVPEPSTLSLIGASLAFLEFARRRKKRRS